MATKFIRDGKLVKGSNVLGDVDISRLNSGEKARALDALERAENGQKMTLENATALLKAREKGRR